MLLDTSALCPEVPGKRQVGNSACVLSDPVCLDRKMSLLWAGHRNVTETCCPGRKAVPSPQYVFAHFSLFVSLPPPGLSEETLTHVSQKPPSNPKGNYLFPSLCLCSHFPFASHFYVPKSFPGPVQMVPLSTEASPVTTARRPLLHLHVLIECLLVPHFLHIKFYLVIQPW